MFQVSHRKNGLSISLAATLDNIDRVAEETRAFLRANRLEHHVFEITLVLREGLMNAVVDGSEQDPTRNVSYSLGLDSQRLTIEIEDTGTGFDWRKRMGRIPVPESESGRGLAIMGIYCDSVQFNESGNKLTLKKKI